MSGDELICGDVVQFKGIKYFDSYMVVQGFVGEELEMAAVKDPDDDNEIFALLDNLVCDRTLRPSDTKIMGMFIFLRNVYSAVRTARNGSDTWKK